MYKTNTTPTGESPDGVYFVKDTENSVKMYLVSNGVVYTVNSI